MPEYAFDVTLNAVVRVTAPTEEKARELLKESLDDDEAWVDSHVGPGLPGSDRDCWITAASMATPVEEAYLFEVDEESVE